jgi:hypothetical protein
MRTTPEIGKHPYWKTCLYCGRKAEDEGIMISAVSIVVANHELNEAFGKSNGYNDDFDVLSPRNYIPLCGARDELESCSQLYSNDSLALLYDPFTSKFYFVTEDGYKRYVSIPEMFHPYRRLLCWRFRKMRNCRTYFDFLATAL